MWVSSRSISPPNFSLIGPLTTEIYNRTGITGITQTNTYTHRGRERERGEGERKRERETESYTLSIQDISSSKKNCVCFFLRERIILI